MSGLTKRQRSDPSPREGPVRADQVPKGEDGSQLCSGGFLRTAVIWYCSGCSWSERQQG